LASGLQSIGFRHDLHILRYTGPNPERVRKPSQERLSAEAILQEAMLDMSDPPCKTLEELLEYVRSTKKTGAASPDLHVSLPSHHGLV
jgi:hypothetical protein